MAVRRQLASRRHIHHNLLQPLDPPSSGTVGFAPSLRRAAQVAASDQIAAERARSMAQHPSASRTTEPSLPAGGPTGRRSRFASDREA